MILTHLPLNQYVSGVKGSVTGDGRPTVINHRFPGQYSESLEYKQAQGSSEAIPTSKGFSGARFTLATQSPHGPIAVASDAEFASLAGIEGWSGNGSSNNPYIIQDYFINGTTGVGVNISNTRVYFVIRNVWVNRTMGAFPNGMGFQLTNVTSGVLTNNTASQNTNYGFYLYNSSLNQLANNSAMNNTNYGFYLQSSSTNTLASNSASNNTIYGFYLQSSSTNTLTSNSASGNIYGFLLVSASSNVLTSNSASNNSNYGFYLSGSNSNVLTNNSASNNSNYGFYLVSSGSNVLTTNNASNNSNSGFYFDVSSSNVLTNNSASGNSDDGFFLSDSNSNRLIKNIATGNELNGFHVTASSGNALIENEAVYNSMRGIVLLSASSFENIIYSNLVFSNIGGNVQDNSTATGNVWRANAYGDYGGSGNYSIPGTAGAVDAAPALLDRDLDGIPDWYEQLHGLNPLSDDAAFDPDHDGFTNIQEFVAGTNPTLPNPLPVIIYATFVNDSVTWLATSPNASTYSIYSNGSLIQSGNWLSGQNISYFAGNLVPNTYNLTVVVSDVYGYTTSHSAIITIAPPLVPVTTTVTNTVTTGTTSTATSTATISVPGSATETLTSTVTSLIEQTLTKTAEGFGIVFAILSMLGILFIARRRHA